MDMYHKNANQEQKKATKTHKESCFQAINTLFSRYYRNFSLKT